MSCDSMVKLAREQRLPRMEWPISTTLPFGGAFQPEDRPSSQNVLTSLRVLGGQPSLDRGIDYRLAAFELGALHSSSQVSGEIYIHWTTEHDASDVSFVRI